MRAAALRIELLIRGPRSLKEKRAVVRPIVDGIRRLASYSVAEVGHHDSWQRASIGVAVVAPDGKQLDRLLSKVSRYLESRPEVEVIEVIQSSMEPEHE